MKLWMNHAIWDKLMLIPFNSLLLIENINMAAVRTFFDGNSTHPIQCKILKILVVTDI